jgi:hypothetical protein
MERDSGLTLAYPENVVKNNFALKVCVLNEAGPIQ